MFFVFLSFSMSKNAILSVYDKTWIVSFAQGLIDLWRTLYSTGGTMRKLQEASIPVTSVSDLTKFPEVLDGRVKTLHPHIYAGILAKRNKTAHMNELATHSIDAIDMVVCNLYPFEETIAQDGVTLEEAQEQIDIGGVTLIRATSKNFQDVIMVSDPTSYSSIVQELSAGDVSHETRRLLAIKWFEHTAAYDTAISDYLQGESKEQWRSDVLHITIDKLQDLRYGENSHQSAAAYKEKGIVDSLADMEVLHGKALSFNNMVDIAWAVYSVSSLYDAGCSVIKHNNPCGLAQSTDINKVLELAWQGDPISAFGSIIAFNQPVEKAALEYLFLEDKTKRKFVEVVVAPAFSEDAFAYLSSRKNLRVIKYDPKRYVPTKDVRHFHGLWLVQEPDTRLHDWLEIMGEHRCDLEAMTGLIEFGLKSVRAIKSNTIALVRTMNDGSYQLLWMWAGQPNRVIARQLAVEKARQNLANEYTGNDLSTYISEQMAQAVMISDAFFPFPDNVELAAEEGIKTIVQPGWSIKDAEVVAAADRLGICMIKSGLRHFYH